MSISGPRLRVVHLITQLELGGAQQNTLYTLGHLSREIFDPILICGPGGILDEEAKKGAWLTHFVPTLVRPVSPMKDFSALFTIYKLLKETKPHIVHTHSSKAGILGRIAAYFAGVPVIIHTFHGFGFTPGQSSLMRGLFIKLEKWCARLSTHLVFVSRDNEEEAQKLGIGVGKPQSLIRSGVKIEDPPFLTTIREQFKIARDAWVVVSVGNFKPQKNPMDLAKVAKAVIERDKDIHFLIVGDGELRKEVEDFAQSQGIAENAHFLGWRTDIPAILSASNCFLLTSLWEGLPRSVVEAAVARLPVVAYSVNGVKEAIVEGESGFAVPAGDVATAADKVLWLRNHPLDGRLMGMKGRSHVEKEFDIVAMVRQQEELYKSLYDAVPLKKYYDAAHAPQETSSPS